MRASHIAPTLHYNDERNVVISWLARNRFEKIAAGVGTEPTTWAMEEKEAYSLCDKCVPGDFESHPHENFVYMVMCCEQCGDWYFDDEPDSANILIFTRDPRKAVEVAK